MMCKEVAVGIDCPDTIGVLEVALRLELRDPGTRLAHQLTIGVLLDEALPGFRRIRALGGTPVLLFLTAGGRQTREEGY